jgi:predicted TIM-barrel fold metal-dependent hydrolase
MPDQNAAEIAVIDADGHVSEITEGIEAFLPPGMKPFAPRHWIDDQGRPRQIVGGEVMPPIPAPAQGWDIPAGGHDPKQRLHDMDRQRILRSVLFPTLGLAFAGIRDTRIQIALCRAYNDWLAGYCAIDAERLLGVSLLPQNDLAGCLEEARRSVELYGYRAVMLRPNPILGRGLHHPYWEPLWDLLEELDVTLAIHEGTTSNVPQSGLDRFDNFAMKHVVSHPHEQQIACVGLIMGGVLERHPGMRVVFLESGCGWMPHWLERIDEHGESWGHATAPLTLTATAYFQRQCFISCDPTEKGIPAFISQLGDENLLFASDYPHPDALAENIVGSISERPELSNESKRRVLETNARRCFGL